MSFFGLHIAVSALRAQQYAMDVTGHNIANASTEGYRRQEPVFIPGNPLTNSFAMTGLGIPQLGTGVLIQTVRRMQTEYVDGQVRYTNQGLGMWNSRNEALQQVESVLMEPGDLGLSNVMDRFWNSWEELSAIPESLAARIAVVETGIALSDRIRSLYGDLRELQTHTDQEIVRNAEEINRLAHEIAAINQEIRKSNAGGYQPNDLMDRRDQLIDELSRIVHIQVHGTAGSELFISISGKVLVQGDHVTEVAVTQGATGWSDLIWSDDDSPVQVTGGELKGQLYMRDTVIEDYIQSLNTIAQAIVNRVNELHVTGFDMDGNPAGDFFTAGTDASDMSVEASLINAPRAVAASATGPIGDNTLALAIADVRNEALINGDTIGNAYDELVARVGSHSREAATQTDVHTLSLQQLDTQRESVSGVSLDEEMVNMVKFQQAYNAAARMVTVLDEMIDTVVNRMGLAGR